MGTPAPETEDLDAVLARVGGEAKVVDITGHLAGPGAADLIVRCESEEGSMCKSTSRCKTTQ